METELQKIEIKLQISDVAGNFLTGLNNTLEAVTHIYHSLKHIDLKEFPPLETETLPLTIYNPNEKKDPNLINQRTLIWVFKKAFDELITSLNSSLVEAYRQTKFMAFYKENNLRNKEEIDEIMKKNEEDSLRLSLPKLIEEIEKELRAELPYKNEILSINKVRNCLVHRNGVVNEVDFNNLDKTSLCLSFYHAIFYVIKEGKKIEITWELRNKGIETNGEMTQELKRVDIHFKKNERLLLDHNIFNGVASTCTFFIYALLDLHYKLLGKGGYEYQPEIVNGTFPI